jgi:hypothetical protein
LAAVLWLATSSGCSLFVKFDDECTTNADCVSRGSTFQCVNRLCVIPGAGIDAGTNLDAGSIRDATPTSCDAYDPSSSACYMCQPETNVQFLNACTGSNCVPFDDSRRVSLFNPDGSLPPVPDLPDASVMD